MGLVGTGQVSTQAGSNDSHPGQPAALKGWTQDLDSRPGLKTWTQGLDSRTGLAHPIEPPGEGQLCLKVESGEAHVDHSAPVSRIDDGRFEHCAAG